MAQAAPTILGGVMLSSKPSVSIRSVRAAKSLRVSTKQSRSRLSIKAQAGKNRDVSAKAAETAVSPPAKEEKSLWDTIKEGITMHYKKSESMYGPGSDRRKKRLPARMRIDGQWYDASGWAAAHPGGARWIHWFDGRDATGVFYALHSYGANGSSLALDRLNKLPKCECPPEEDLHLPLPRDMDVNCSFQELRVKLEQEGFFKRSALKEAIPLAQIVGLYVAGTMLAWTQPVVATILLSLGAQQAGWLAHDYIHGRGKWCDSMRWFGAVFNGHSDNWWSQKHSLHHSFTNEERHDNDVMMEPFFFLRPPAESGRADSPTRKFQHIYGYPLLAIMYWLWRALSLQTAFNNKNKYELCLLGLNYAWMLFCLPSAVAIGHVFLGGFLVGALVSATHQSEELMLQGDEPDFVMGQFRSTRDAETVLGPVETWLWGGMDTQLEHHLFPSMPRYNYHKVRPILKKWAEEHNVNYRISPSTTIIRDNWMTLYNVAHA